MIYISSSCVRAKTINSAVQQLVNNGYNHIELSGGTAFYEDWLNDLKSWKKKGVQFLMHNYFPPPQEPFVLNLASLDKEIAFRSVDHVYNALQYAHELEVPRIGFHAGFLINIPVSQIGKGIDRQKLFDKDEAWGCFTDRYNQIRSRAKKLGVELYLENNVLSAENYRTFNHTNPFFLVDESGFLQHKAQLPDFKLILDVGHLWVSSNALEFEFESSFKAFLKECDYIHVSDNNGLEDQNKGLSQSSVIYNALKEENLKQKIITLEVYEGFEAIERTLKLLKPML